MEQSVEESLAGMVATAVEAALAEQAAVTDLRFAQLSEAVAQVGADAATDNMHLVERLRTLLARHDETVEARLGSFQSELGRLRLMISELRQRGERDDPEPPADPSAAATVLLEEAVAAFSDENQQLRRVWQLRMR